MRRTINSTGRQRIERGDIALMLSGPEGGPRVFDLQLTLEEYELPKDAKVFVEASRQTTWMRFDFGTVGNFTPPSVEGRTLTELGSAQGVTFRIKVVDGAGTNADFPAARILAQADQVPAGDPDEGPAKSMLAIDWDEEPRGDELWRVEVGETEVVLRVNKRMLGGAHWTALTEHRAFRAAAMPAIFDQILTRILLIDRAEDPAQGPLGAWIRFAQTTLGTGPVPETEDGDVVARQEWIDQAVAAFSRKRNIKGAAIEAKLIGGDA